MKKLLAILLTLTLGFSLCACGAKTPVNNTDSDDDFQFTFDDTVQSATTSSTTSTPESTTSSKDNGTTNSSTVVSSIPANNSSSIIDITTEIDNRIIVTCWGDSITQGMHYESQSYPVRLQEMLGENYKVYNGGDSGETTATIAARQGGLKVYTTRKITFDRGKDNKLVSTEKQDIFVTETGIPVTLTNALGNGISVNNVKINGEEYQLKFESFNWEPRTFKLYLYRNGDTSTTVSIPQGSEVIFSGSDLSTKGGVDIYMMGANGGYKSSDAEYIAQLKAMIKHHGNDKYLIIKPYWGNIKGLEEFGDHLIDFSILAAAEGLTYEGLTPTEEDIKACNANKIPASLRYNNEPNNSHLNAYGYHFLAHCIHEKGKTLGYW